MEIMISYPHQCYNHFLTCWFTSMKIPEWLKCHSSFTKSRTLPFSFGGKSFRKIVPQVHQSPSTNFTCEFQKQHLFYVNLFLLGFMYFTCCGPSSISWSLIQYIYSILTIMLKPWGQYYWAGTLVECLISISTILVAFLMIEFKIS